MEMKQVWTVIKVFLVLPLVFLFGCSGYLGTKASLRIQLPQLSGYSSSQQGRYVSASTNQVHLGLLKGERIHVYREITYPTETVVLDHLIPDDYILYVVLLSNNGNDGQDMVGSAIKELSIKPGDNTFTVKIGPGAKVFTLNSVSIGNFFDTRDSYSIGLKEDTLVIKTGEREPEGDKIKYKPYFGSNELAIISNAKYFTGEAIRPSQDEHWLIPPEHNGIIFTMHREGDPSLEYTQILEIQ